MNRISVTELIEFIQDKDLLDTSLEQPEYSMNRPRRDEEWMFSNNEVPPMWSNKLVNIDQPFSLGQPLLAPLSKPEILILEKCFGSRLIMNSTMASSNRE